MAKDEPALSLARRNGQQASPASDGELLRRFAGARDQTAFADLVQRHGPMVWSVCRRILPNSHDAEDAFQATFLVLVKKAGSLAQADLLANWLYGVAFRTARKARALAYQHQARERQAATMMPVQQNVEGSRHGLREALDEALAGLPEKYRAPLVLCYLEGKTNEEAARLLGWPPGSMSKRLAQGREMLRQRLDQQRGLLPAGSFAALLAEQARPVAPPAEVVDSTVRASLHLLNTGDAAGGSLTAGILAETLLAPQKPRWIWPVVAMVLSGIILAGGWSLYAATRNEEKQMEPTIRRPLNPGKTLERGLQRCDVDE